MINKNNWIIGSDWIDIWKQASDTFSVEQNEEKLTITRTDSDGTWGLNLAFHCCFKGIKNVIALNVRKMFMYFKHDVIY